MKIGLFGGTFNPVHSGHVTIIADLVSSFPLDRVIIIPAATPPHKPSDFMADISMRLEMARLAFAAMPQCVVSDIETRRPGRSYSIDTVTHFLKTLPPDGGLFFITGLDAFLELDTWKQYLNLVEIISFIVINRPFSGQPALEALASFLSAKISADYAYDPEKACFVHPTLKPIFFYQHPTVGISSTEIRRRLKSGRPVRSLLPMAVEQFIKEKGLYQ